MQKARAFLAAIFVAVAAMALVPGSASAILTHSTSTKFPLGDPGECPGNFGSGAQEVAADESRDLVYVVCERGGTLGPTIRRFHYDGTPAPFEASGKPYLSGNEIIGNPNSPVLEWQNHQFQQTVIGLAVDNSSAHNGFLFVAGGCRQCGEFTGAGQRMVMVFKPNGELFQELAPLEVEEAIDVAVGPNGDVYVLNTHNEASLVRVFDGQTLAEKERLFPGKIRDYVAADSTGSIWTGYYASEGITPTLLSKFEPDQRTTALNDEEIVQEILTQSGPPEVQPSPYVAEGGRLGFSGTSPTDIAVDASNDDLYVDLGNRILSFSPGSAEEKTFQNGPVIGSGVLAQSPGMAVTSDGHVFATMGSEVVNFGPGQTVPDIRTPVPNIDELGHETATLHAHVERSGGTPITGCKLEIGTSANPASWTGEAACVPDASGTHYTAPETPVEATATSLTPGTKYFYRFKATNEEGSNFGEVLSFTAPFVLKLHTEPAEVEPNSAILKGSLDPAGEETHYYFEYGATTSYGQKTTEELAGTAPGKVDLSAPLASLPAGTLFHFRLVAHNLKGTTTGEDLTFRTASPPNIAGQQATEVTATSATLHARIDPVGYETKYRFEYGTTPSYGSTIPVPEKILPAGSGFVPVSEQVSNLEQGVTYHFRVVAKNQWGETAGEDTTFNFAPPACPNEHVRQQTGANYLPDCRAYELVSPSNSGAVIYLPSLMLSKVFFLNAPGFHLWPNNYGYAENPSRFTYWGALGAPEDANVPNSLVDMYAATRTPTGWVQSAPGLHGNETEFGTEKECSNTIDLCSDHFGLDGLFGEFPGESAPYLFSADGSPLGQLPSNVNVVKGGKEFVGDQRFSGDFSHFAFSSNNAIFTLEGVNGSGPAPGSAYDNDISEKTVKLISRLGSGNPIPRDTCCDQFIKFPAISADGSHILMSVQGVGGPQHLYMSIHDGPVDDVSHGAGVTFIGMTRSGSKVFFIANQALTGDDTDSSADLYMWSESTDELTLLSVGNGNGNSNSCTPVQGYSSGCGVAMVKTEKESPFGVSSIPGLDDKIAEDSGDVYFYSPELLDPNSPGVINARNLYVYRNGAVRLVATLNGTTQIKRMQISLNGDHAAFITNARLTAYENNGFNEMYTYNAVTGTIACASCKPNGLPPHDNVEGSQGGRFMSEDGRVFFATRDPLVAQDTNGQIADVYEFVDGRPQLISKGTNSRDLAGSGFLFPPTRLGLEAVSRDGVDVYFATFDVLTPEDRNGPFLKFYDARTNGGFDVNYQIAPCEAADECHGEDSSPPAAPQIGTRGGLGQSGNVVTKRKAKKHGKRHHKRHVRSHRKGSHGHPRRSHG
jgi:hypothetical protein